MERLSRDAFFELPIPELEARCGLAAPEGATAAELAEFRDKAWESYKLDVANRDEWGGTEGESIPQPDTD